MLQTGKIAVVGAGIAGLTVARFLSAVADVTVFEKSRGVGGRMATRRIGENSFDHGAQYFTIRDPLFHDALDVAIDEGVIEAWTGMIGVSTSASPHIEQYRSREPRFVGTPHMTSLPKWLARGLSIRLGEKIHGIKGVSRRWCLASDTGDFGPFDWVVITSPVAQCLELMPHGFKERDRIASARMSSCFTLMIDAERSPITPFCAVRFDDEVIGWIADGSTRPHRHDSISVVVHSRNRWADLHINEDASKVQDIMMRRLSELMPGFKDSTRSVGIHRWRYASVKTPVGGEPLIDFDEGLAACGDWTLGNRVEAAFLSAARTAEGIKTTFLEPIGDACGGKP